MNKKGFQAMAMMLMCAASAGGTLYGTPRRETKKRQVNVKPVQPKELHEFTIKGHTIMAYSKKDAISRLKAQGKITKKKK